MIKKGEHVVSIPGPVGGSFPVITGAANAYPPSRSQEELWDGFFARHYQQDRRARRVFMSVGIRQRHNVIDIAAHTVADAASLMTWSITDTGFLMTLDRQVPDVLARHVGPAIDDLLTRNGLRRGDVQAWAVHPGGPRILDVVADRLGLAEDDLDTSRRVLAQHGNCSSATLLLVLSELRGRALPPGAPIIAMAFGPGLTLYACLLRWAEANHAE
jgi:predicted naringenin-chalcone synthase